MDQCSRAHARNVDLKSTCTIVLVQSPKEERGRPRPLVTRRPKFWEVTVGLAQGPQVNPLGNG